MVDMVCEKGIRGACIVVGAVTYGRPGLWGVGQCRHLDELRIIMIRCQHLRTSLEVGKLNTCVDGHEGVKVVRRDTSGKYVCGFQNSRFLYVYL